MDASQLQLTEDSPPRIPLPEGKDCFGPAYNPATQPCAARCIQFLCHEGPGGRLVKVCNTQSPRFNIATFVL